MDFHGGFAIRLPYNANCTLGIACELRQKLTLKFLYVGSRTTHFAHCIDVNGALAKFVLSTPE